MRGCPEVVVSFHLWYSWAALYAIAPIDVTVQWISCMFFFFLSLQKERWAKTTISSFSCFQKFDDSYMFFSSFWVFDLKILFLPQRVQRFFTIFLLFAVVMEGCIEQETGPGGNNYTGLLSYFLCVIMHRMYWLQRVSVKTNILWLGSEEWKRILSKIFNPATLCVPLNRTHVWTLVSTAVSLSLLKPTADQHSRLFKENQALTILNIPKYAVRWLKKINLINFRFCN